MLFPSKIHMLKSNPQYDTKRCSLGEQLGHKGSALIKEAQGSLFAPLFCKEMEKAPSIKVALTKHQIFWCLHLELPSLQNCEK
jgi:hypothetical protein